MSKQTSTIGVDEAGRGPIAGPVAVGACKISNSALGDLSKELIEEFMRGTLKDSKKLSEKKRTDIYSWMQAKQETGELIFTVSMGASNTIDKEGIVPTISMAVSKVLTVLAKEQESDVLVKLDGGLKAPSAFKHQQTIVRGDESEVTISLASIAAKVTRDEYMKKLAIKHSEYGFERHKGYGTRAHYEVITQHGLISEHRKSFCKNIIK